MIRILVVDDSLVMRKAISRIFEQADDMTVADTATNGKEGVEKARRLEPDVVTMDVEMPKMNGIEAVRRIMDTDPRPILMLSSLTEKGAEVTIEAMQAGAADFLPKGESSATLRADDVEAKLLKKVQALAHSNARLFEDGGEGPGLNSSSSGARTTSTSSRASSSRSSGTISSGTAPSPEASYELAVIGVSTGGPMALQHVIPALPAEFPLPVAVVQHMPPQFTRSLSDRLDSLSALSVAEADEGMLLEPGRVVVAAGDRHLTVERRKGELSVCTPAEPAEGSHRPSANVLFRSAAEVCRGRILTVVMTGMGKDGLEGVRDIKEEGGTVYIQDEDTSVVYGMPGVVAEAGLADGSFPLDSLPDAMQKAVGTPARP
ncbi:protein-glutamate methylesterase/protein-glutamine glutaminase [Salinibacter altiplanensis]|uniref:protein-glutamate methylesterase/protein-glutamine glutaminase n=1 Tax=Salinibacter altiplanensis TaxID=1803181 RepID=UPI000C9F8A08|nr:chemotaxis response regulator protein-glutamate methylesterase [Salinibacter altiplanensis]